MSATLCRIGGIPMHVEPFTGSNSSLFYVSCPLLLGTSPASVELSPDNGKTYYILPTVPTIPALNPNLTSTWNQLNDSTFTVGWTGLDNCPYVDITFYIQTSSSPIAAASTLTNVPNTGATTIYVPHGILVIICD